MQTIAQTQARLAAGEVTSVALTKAALDKASAPGGEGARVFIALRAEKALAAAAASDAARKAGLVRSPLEGIPVSVKDLFDIAGDVTRAGSLVLSDAAPAAKDAEAVARLQRAGAVIIGRTNMTEFAFSGVGLNPHYGTPKNPFDRTSARIPGGSSSGAAISVTDGMAIAALGTDTGGSVRIPSALCGLVGFKPTARRVPTTGALPLSYALDSIGPLAASVACCAAMDAVLSGEPEALPPAVPDLAGLRFAIPTTVVLDGLDAAVASAFHRAVEVLSKAGAKITEITVPEFAALGGINAKGGLAAAEAWHWHRTLLESRGERYDPRVKVRMMRGRDMSAADYIDLLKARPEWIRSVEAHFAPFDAVLMPTVPTIAPRIEELADEGEYGRINMLMLRNPSIINFLDGCALSVPCHSPGEAPVGLMIAGVGGRDRAILGIGEAISRALA